MYVVKIGTSVDFLQKSVQKPAIDFEVFIIFHYFLFLTNCEFPYFAVGLKYKDGPGNDYCFFANA